MGRKAEKERFAALIRTGPIRVHTHEQGLPSLVNGAGMRSQSSVVRRFKSCPLHQRVGMCSGDAGWIVFRIPGNGELLPDSELLRCCPRTA